MPEWNNNSILTSRENLPVSDEVRKAESRKLVNEGKLLSASGQLEKSLKYFHKAQKLFPSEKTLAKIKRIEEVIAKDECDEEDYGYIQLDNGLVIFKQLVERLYPHQIDGIKWFYNLYTNKKKGGILADDMGLGKTIQVISFLSAMFDMGNIKTVLLVLPLSLIPNWTAEFEKWAPGIRTECYHGPASKRRSVLESCQRNRCVCFTTYGMIVTAWEALGKRLDGREHVWDYIILDEGHRIKNPTKTTKGLHKIPSRNRLVLTGTPVQNKVRDLWALMDWVLQGSLLGTQKTFRSDYEIPIERARQRDASAGEIHLGNSMAESLRKLTDPFILRRTKDMLNAEIAAAKKKNGGISDSNQDQSLIQKQPTFPKLSTKNDMVVWVFLSKIQLKIYQDFIEMDSIKDLLASKRSPLIYLTIIKKICDHPRLLSTKGCVELGLEFDGNLSSSNLNLSAIEDCAANRIDNVTDETLMEESGKLQFLIQLMGRLREEGHRTLIFSKSRKMLNIIQRILLNRRFKIMRLDGRVTKLAEREKRVKKFQEDSTYQVFLLTTQVGGVGLTLTAADRVVIYDPSWNPATDAQAVDRIYRIGQKKSVVVYRLITCGTVEEKIYRRQIFKSSVIQQSVDGSKDPYRYFTSQDLKELFILGDVESSDTQRQLEELHGSQRNIDDKLKEHIQEIKQFNMAGLSDHDLMFSRKADDFDYENEMTENYDGMVEQAQDKLKLESGQLPDAEDRWGAFNAAKPKSESKTDDDNEPIYPIEGITDKVSDLHLPSYGINKQEWEGITPEQSPKKFKDANHANKSDDEIMFFDSPLASAPPASFLTKSSLASENVVLADESPMTSIIKPTTTPSITEVEDSFDLFGKNIEEESSDNESLDGDDGWKNAFAEEKIEHDDAVQTGASESAKNLVHDEAKNSSGMNRSANNRLSNISALSEQSPLFGRSKNHRFQLIESDSDQEAEEDDGAVHIDGDDVIDESDKGDDVNDSDATDNDEHDVTNYESDFIDDETHSSGTEYLSDDFQTNPDELEQVDFNFDQAVAVNETSSDRFGQDSTHDQAAGSSNSVRENEASASANDVAVNAESNDDFIDSRDGAMKSGDDDVTAYHVDDVSGTDEQSSFVEDVSLYDSYTHGDASMVDDVNETRDVDVTNSDQNDLRDDDIGESQNSFNKLVFNPDGSISNVSYNYDDDETGDVLNESNVSEEDNGLGCLALERSDSFEF